MHLHRQIMNLPCPALNFDGLDRNYVNAHKLGHRDARHAAAELALKADVCIEVLRMLDKRLRECSTIPASAAEAYDSFYQESVSEALAAFGEH